MRVKFQSSLDKELISTSGELSNLFIMVTKAIQEKNRIDKLLKRHKKVSSKVHLVRYGLLLELIQKYERLRPEDLQDKDLIVQHGENPRDC